LTSNKNVEIQSDTPSKKKKNKNNNKSIEQNLNNNNNANNSTTSNDVTKLKNKPTYDGNVLETAVFLETSLTIGQLDKENKIDFSKALGKNLEDLISTTFSDETHIDDDKNYRKHLIEVYANKLLLEACNSQQDDIDKSRQLFRYPFSDNKSKDIKFRKDVFAEMISLMKKNKINITQELKLAVSLHKKSKTRLLETNY